MIFYLKNQSDDFLTKKSVIFKEKKTMNKHMLVLVLTHKESMNQVIKAFAENDIHGSTIIDSMGMAAVINNEDYEDLPMFGILRHIMDDDDEKEKNYTVFTVLNDEDLEKAKKIVKEVCGNLNKPNSGIMFTLPVDFVEGVVE